MCNCKNVELWSYDNQVYVPMDELPQHMRAYWLYRRGLDHDKWICIDKCVEQIIWDLWDNGITTTGCCCGHNKEYWYVWVIELDMEYYKSLSHYAKEKDIDWRTAKRHEGVHVFKLSVKWKNCYVETLQIMQFMVKCHVKLHVKNQTNEELDE